MDQNKLNEIKAEISAAVNIAGNIVGMIVPGQAAYIALGRALAVMAPELYQDAVLLFQQKEPTQADQDLLAEDIHTLLNPETA